MSLKRKKVKWCLPHFRGRLEVLWLVLGLDSDRKPALMTASNGAVKAPLAAPNEPRVITFVHNVAQTLKVWNNGMTA